MDFSEIVQAHLDGLSLDGQSLATGYGKPTNICKPGDFYLDLTDQQLYCAAPNGDFFKVANLTTTQHGPEGMNVPCSANGHEVGNSAEDIVVYEDGMIVGYCVHCQARCAIPFVVGGTNLLRLRDLGAQLLAAERLHGEAVPLKEFNDAFDALQEQYEEIKSLLDTAETIKVSIARKWLREEAEGV